MPNIKYAQLFNIGAGAGADTINYLFVRHLGGGVQGTAQCLLNLSDKELYVRKLVKRQDPNIPDVEVQAARVISSSVSSSQAYPFVPRLTKHAVVVKDSNDTILRDTNTIWTLCNGGELQDLIESYDMMGEPVPAALIWRFLSQTLSTLHHLQSSPVAIAHHDLLSCNIFLHWPTPTTKWPDFYIGDFGRATFKAEDFKGFCGDIRALQGIADHGLAFIVESHDNVPPNLFPPSSYPKPLINFLKKMSRLVKVAEETKTKPFLGVLVAIARAEARASEETCAQDITWTREKHANTAQLYDSKKDVLNSTNVVGPWHIATVDADTLQVIEVEGQTHSRPNYGNTDNTSEEEQDPAFGSGAMTFSGFVKFKAAQGQGQQSEQDQITANHMFLTNDQGEMEQTQMDSSTEQALKEFEKSVVSDQGDEEDEEYDSSAERAFFEFQEQQPSVERAVPN